MCVVMRVIICVMLLMVLADAMMEVPGARFQCVADD